MKTCQTEPEPSPVGDAATWRYEFRPDEKYPDLGIYTILAPNPDAGKEGVVYSGKEIAMADTDDKDVAAQIVSDHALAALVPELVEALKEMIGVEYRHGSPAKREAEFLAAVERGRAALARVEALKQ